jgi:hypothetical protein
MSEPHAACPRCGQTMDSIKHEPTRCQVCGRIVCHACTTRVRDWLDTAGAMEVVCLWCLRSPNDC